MSLSYFLNFIGIKLPQFENSPAQINTEISSFILGESSPYFKYFLAKEDPKKENLILLYESIYQRRILVSTSVLVFYNLIKSFLWRRGYFAYFFFHTRGMSIYIYLLSLYLFKSNFNACLNQDDLLRYYEKRNSYKLTKNSIDNFVAKESSLKQMNADNFY